MYIRVRYVYRRLDMYIGFINISREPYSWYFDSNGASYIRPFLNDIVIAVFCTFVYNHEMVFSS